MTTQTSTSEAAIEAEYEAQISASDVAEHLRQNADFFTQFPDLLEALTLPHRSGGTISLVERQIEVLRDKNTRLESRLNTLIDVARQNNETQQQLHQLAVEVLARDNLNDALTVLTERLANQLSVDHVEARIFSDKQHPVRNISDSYLLTSESAQQALDDFTPAIEPFCGRLKPAQLKRLFGKQAEKIGSCGLIPLRCGPLYGLVALGSNDEHRFNPGMDTLYLQRLGELVSAALLRHL